MKKLPRRTAPLVLLGEIMGVVDRSRRAFLKLATIASTPLHLHDIEFYLSILFTLAHIFAVTHPANVPLLKAIMRNIL